MNQTAIVSIFSVLSFMLPNHLSAHPTELPHTHNNQKVLWESDGSRDGSSPHNHMFARNFGGDQNVREPYSADGCWDNGVWRNTEIFQNPTFDQGHCYVDLLNPLNIVTYNFDNAIPASAKSRVRDAFDRWSALGTFSTTIVEHGIQGNAVGIQFVELSLPGADINVLWQNIGDGMGGGAWSDLTAQLIFDSSYSWDYTSSPGAADNAKYHFLSVALHEVGHAVGLEHQLDFRDDVMAPPVGGPGPSGTRNLFFEIDADSAQGVYELYGQTPSVPAPPACTFHFEPASCDGGVATEYILTPLLSGHSVVDQIIEKQTFGGGWQSVYQGLQTCIGAPSFGSLYRATLTLSTGLQSQCQIILNVSTCGGGGPLGGGGGL